MAVTVARIQIPNASMLVANIAAATNYFIPRGTVSANNNLLVATSATLPAQYIFDVSQYSSCLLVATTAGMTTAAGCVVSAQAIHPDLQPLPAASQPVVISGAGFLKSAPAIGATASTQAIPFNDPANAGRMTHCALNITFTTLPTAGADLWVYLLGFPWKSYE